VCVCVCVILWQSKTLSLDPAKKALLTLRRPFGSETAESVDLKRVAVQATQVPENNDVLTRLEPTSTQLITSSQDKVSIIFSLL